MQTKNSVEKPSTTPAWEPYTTGSVTSKDGTTIGYRQLGQGPALVLVQGAMGSAQNFMQLAGMLADAFTVYLPDRRGRGQSPLAYSKNYRIQKDVEDIDALLAKTGAHAVFGLSSGALICLEAALTLPAIHQAAIYALEQVLPHVKRVEFPGLGHAAAWNYDKQRNPGGQPEVVAQALRRFFAEPEHS